MKIRFVFVCEGSSDHGLVAHLETLCLRAGAEEVKGLIPDLNLYRGDDADKTVEGQVRAALALEPNADLVFVHRDADSTAVAIRRAQIETGIQAVLGVSRHVPVVPVRELEAWLLLNEEAIRHVAENPNGKSDLGLPALRQIESTADPKQRLKDALERACKYKGRRLEAFKKQFSSQRARLLEHIDTDGLIRQLPAWQQLEQDVAQAIQALSKG